MINFIQALALPIVVGVISLSLAIAVSVFLAACFYEIACEKGFEERRYFWIPFLFGLVGYLLVIALPDRGSEFTIQSGQGQENQLSR